MTECNYSQKFNNTVDGIFINYENGDLTEDQLWPSVKSYLAKVKDEAKQDGLSTITNEDLTEWMDLIVDSFDAFDIKLPESRETIAGIIMQTNQGSEPKAEELSDEFTSKGLENVETVRDITVDEIYKGVPAVKRDAMREMSVNLTRCLLFDLSQKTLTRNSDDLNTRMHKFQQEYFSYVCRYLKQNLHNADDIPFLQGTRFILTDKNFSLIEQYANKHFNTMRVDDMIDDYKVNAIRLEAFKKFQALKYFDKIVQTINPDVSSIGKNRFGRKYTLTSKAVNMFWAKGDDDDIDMIQTGSKVVKMIVQSLDMYDYKTGKRIDGSYMKYSNYVNAIGKVHQLSWRQEARDISLTSLIKEFEKTNSKLKLSKGSIEFIRQVHEEFPNASLATLLNRMRINIDEAYPAVFEILSSSLAKSATQFKFLREMLNPADLNTIYSLSAQIFGNKSGSLTYLYNTQGYDLKSANYIDYMLQSADSIWPVPNAQYLASADSGEIALNGLTMSQEDVERFKLQDTINRQNSPKLSKLPEKYKVTFNPTNHNLTTMQLGEHIILELDTKGNVQLYYKDGDKQTKLRKDKTEVQLKEIQDTLLTFVDDILKQNFKNSPEYYKAVVQTYETGNPLLDRAVGETAINNLTEYAANVLKNIYISQQVFKKYAVPTKKIFEITVETYYGANNDFAPKVVPRYRGIELCPKKKNDLGLNKVALASMMVQGSALSTVVSDADGKKVSMSAPSRLMGTLLMQHESIRNNPLNPAYNLSIIQDYWMEDLQTVRDYKSATGQDNKLYKNFNTREFLESTLMYDFLTPLVGDKEHDYSLTSKSGRIAVTPSVNSDKNTIAKMIVDLNRIVSAFNRKEKPEPPIASWQELMSKDFPPERLNQYVANELGQYYVTLVKRLHEDYRRMEQTPTWQRYASGIQLSYNNPNTFLDLNIALKTAGINPRTFFDKVSREGNLTIKEPLHVEFAKGGNITLNRSLFSLYMRAQNRPVLLQKFQIPSWQQFMQYKNAEFLQSLLRTGVKLDITRSDTLYNAYKFSSWVNPSGNMIFAKIARGTYTYTDTNGHKKSATRWFNITSIHDLLELEKDPIIQSRLLKQDKDGNVIKEHIIDNPHVLADLIKMNPMLEKYNTLAYMTSQEYLMTSVGSHINHPTKFKHGFESAWELNDYLKDEASRYQAQHKRNVSQTASMHEFKLNQLNGIPSHYNIACIQDINDQVYNMFGMNPDVKPFDGATFVAPWVVWLENNSLNGQKAGTHKKQFVHFYDRKTGTGGIIKTAGFGITNDWIRKSPFIKRMLRNMSIQKWTDEDGNPYIADVTDGGKNHYEIYYKIPARDENGQLKVDKDGKHYFEYFTREISFANGQYQYNDYVVKEDGTKILGENTPVAKSGSVVIDNNYALWELFGGEHSVSLNEQGKLSGKDKYGEASIANMVDAMNQTIIRKPNIDNPQNQNQCYQPLKHSGAHYAVTEGALKQGTANFNTKDVYYQEADMESEDGFKGFNTFEIIMDQAGIQLDKEHHADNSELSMMTQVVSACAALGYTWDESNKMYQALQSLSMQGIKSVRDPLMELLGLKGKEGYEETAAEFEKTVANIIVKSLANGSSESDGVLYDMVSELVKKYKVGEEITDSDIKANPIVFSDPAVFGKVVSLLSSGLTNASIKMKFSGILSVLVPSHETMKVISRPEGGAPKLYDNLVSPHEELIDMQAKMPIHDVSHVQMGRKYKRFIDGEYVDTVMVQAPVVNHKGVYGHPNLHIVSYYDLTDEYEYQEEIYDENTGEYGRNLGAYFGTFDDVTTGRHFNFYDVAVVKELYQIPEKIEAIENDEEKSDEVKKLEISTLNSRAKQLRKEINNILPQLKNGGQVTISDHDNNEFTVTLSNVKIQPYEVIMPKIFKEKLGLDENDDLDSLYNDKKSFVKKIRHNLEQVNVNTIPESYTYALKRTNGKHIYILTTKDLSISNIELNTPPYLVDIHRDEDGKLYRWLGKEQMYEMNDGDKIVVNEDGQEIIVTNNEDLYLENVDYAIIDTSPGNAVAINHILGFNLINISSPNHPAIERFHEAQQKTSQKDTQLNYDTYINRLGESLYNSFKKTLDIVAARIPAQSMQSFMPMRVVGYEDSDINTAFVSTHQIWLQGSDYDIDAVSLLCYELNRNGMFDGWSPYFNLRNEVNFRESMEFNYPSGKIIFSEQDRIDSENLIQEKSQLLENEEDENKIKQLQKEIKQEEKKLNNSDNQQRLQIDSVDEIVEHLDQFLPGFVIQTQKYKQYDNAGDSESEEIDKVSINRRNFGAFVKAINYISETGLVELQHNQLEEVTARINEKYNLKINDITKVLQDIEHFVNRHNAYVSNSRASTFTKNYIVEQMFRIAKDPRNRIQAEMSVDDTTGEPKQIAKDYSKVDRLLDDATPGNIGNTYQSIEDNHVGKEVIGIAAVGLKSFFAISQYINTLIKQGRTSELFTHPLTFNGKNYYTLANANFNTEEAQATLRSALGNDPEAIRIIETEPDEALAISALLSLATDNAKELCLAKLNADANLAGMYIYGLSMGISFRELGRMLMSPMGSTVLALTKGSIFTGRMNFNQVSSVINFLNNPASEMMKLIYSLRYEEKDKDESGKEISKSVSVKKVLQEAFNGAVKKVDENGEAILNENGEAEWTQSNIFQALGVVLSRKYGQEYYKANKQELSKRYKDLLWRQVKWGKKTIPMLSQYDVFMKECLKEAKKPDCDLEVLNDIIEAIRWSVSNIRKHQIQDKTFDPYVYHANYKTMFANQVLDIVQDSIQAIYDVNHSEFQFSDFIKIQQGAAQFKKMGALFGLNKGLKNSAEEVLKFVGNFESLIEDQMKIYNLKALPKINDVQMELVPGDPKITKVDFEQFMVDENYRERVYQVYDSIVESVSKRKDAAESNNLHAFNPYRIMMEVPHYQGYLMTAWTQHALFMKESQRHQLLHEWLPKMKKIVGYTDANKNYKSLNKLIDDTIADKYLATKQIYIPSGSDMIIVRQQGANLVQDSYETTVPTKLTLGTPSANATFMRWMESEVIPNLKNGQLDKNGVYQNPYLKYNGFISSLQERSFSLNPNHMDSVNFSPNINMSPRDEEGMIALDKLRIDFNNLSSQVYYVEDPSGRFYPIPVRDLFYYYNIVAFGNKNGEASLASLFTGVVNESMDEPKAYRRIGKMFDNGEFNIQLDLQNIINYCAPVGNPVGSRNPYIWYRDPETMLLRRMTQGVAEERDEEGNSIPVEHEIGLYDTSYRIGVDPDLFPRLPIAPETNGIQSTTVSFGKGDKAVKVGVLYKGDKLLRLAIPGLGDIISAQELNKLQQTKKNPLITKWIDGTPNLNSKAIEPLIQKKLNC